MILSNVVNSIGRPLFPDENAHFLRRIFVALKETMGGEFQDFTFVVHHRSRGEFAGQKINLDAGGPDRILILLSDEKEVFPLEDYQSYRVIFRSYGKLQGEESHIQPFPVGYLNAVGEVEPVPFMKRKVPVFFSGYLNRNRVDLYKQFRPLFWLPGRNLKTRHTRELARRAIEKFCPERSFRPAQWPGAQIDFTEWFGKGLEPNMYAKVLADTQIALCPPGFVSHETIRHWEAMRLGCVIISAPLPDNRFYKNSPIIQLEDWSTLTDTLSNLLSEKAALMKIHEATKLWWDQMCSEMAIARYMSRVIREKINPSH